ncbi:putative benomyl methotrexate resistance protein [Rutstroemia sp. NJR-2017a BBW]|nr:putative benomyl methotrexate resistance protein [Rutstroemia sp. NJR-2017a BBW]
MQSLLAHRRFGRLVQEQYERDKHRAEAMQRGNALNTEANANANDAGTNGHRASSIDTTSSTNVPTPASLDPRDPEKAEQPDTHSPSSSHPDDIPAERTATHATAHTTRSFGTRLGHALSGIEVRELSAQLTRTRTKKGKHIPPPTDKPGEGEKEIVFVVGYESESDPMNPHNWPVTKRIFCTIMIASIGFIVGFASSIDSAALTQASEEFGVSEVAESLATGLFLVGFGFGALFAGPISETIGRNPVYIVTLLIYMIWIMASALAPNLGAQLVFRFLAGFFGSTPLTCAGGSISDLWNPMERVFAFPVFANAAFMGPIFGPVVGGFVGQSSLVSWRWCEWITLILSGAILLLVFLFQPETFAPILLKWKASHLRRITHDERYVAEVEIRADSFAKRLMRALYRPFILTAREPIVMLFALYLTVVYIILFTFLDGYTYIFGETYGFSEGLVGLSFVGIAIGLCFASLLVPLIYYWARRDLAKLRAEKGPNARLPPEQRLWFAMFGAPAVPISLFWMGWTNYPSISPWSGLVASLVFGYGILCIFISTYQYIIDSYEMYAASALASLTLIRYVAAGGMVEVGIPFYENMGVHWTLTILGAISALMVPVPYLFYIYGPKIRGWSKYAARH